MPGPDTFHVSSKNDTLYDALGVAEDASHWQVRKVAKAIRRDHTTADDYLHDVCLAQEVLGDPELRAEYDALLARLRGAGQPVPKIGVAIEGSRLGPALSAQIADATTAGFRAGARAGAQLFKALAIFALIVGVIVLIAIGIGSNGGGYRSRYEPIKIPEFRMPPIEIPKFEMPPIDYSKYSIPPPRIEIPEFKPLDEPKQRVRTKPAKKSSSSSSPSSKARTPKAAPAPKAEAPVESDTVPSP